MLILEKNLPGLQIYQLSDLAICDNLISKLNDIRDSNACENFNKTCFKSNGYQSGNLINLHDIDLLEISMLIRFHLARNFKILQEEIEVIFLHFLDYNTHGRMEEHNHSENEDFTFLLYLNDCDDGDTVFYLNHTNDNARMRSKIKVKPRKGRLVVFNSSVPHFGSFTKSNKMIFAGGLIYRLCEMDIS